MMIRVCKSIGWGETRFTNTRLTPVGCSFERGPKERNRCVDVGCHAD